MENEQNQKKSYLLPISILIAGVLISGSLIYNAGSSAKSDLTANIGNALPQAPTAPPVDLNALKPITKNDHIRGNLKAPVKIVEFSDLECPFCKRFHSTMKQVINEYGKNGKVAWVYRHFPLDQLHSKARKEAQATECANELGGNDKFWAYADRVFEITPSNNGLDPSLLPKIAEEIGLNRSKFESCLNSNKYKQHIENSVQDAVASGGRGTPWSIVVTAGGKKFPLNGAQPYPAVKQLIEQALNAN